MVLLLSYQIHCEQCYVWSSLTLSINIILDVFINVDRIRVPLRIAGGVLPGGYNII